LLGNTQHMSGETHFVATFWLIYPSIGVFSTGLISILEFS